MKLTGKVIQILAPQSGVSQSGREWSKQEFIIETNEQYPKKICVSMFNEKIVPLSVGETITAHVNIESREFKGRWYTEVQAWKIERDNQVSQDAHNTHTNFAKGDDMPF